MNLSCDVCYHVTLFFAFFVPVIPIIIIIIGVFFGAFPLYTHVRCDVTHHSGEGAVADVIGAQR